MTAATAHPTVSAYLLRVIHGDGHQFPIEPTEHVDEQAQPGLPREAGDGTAIELPIRPRKSIPIVDGQVGDDLGDAPGADSRVEGESARFPRAVSGPLSASTSRSVGVLVREAIRNRRVRPAAPRARVPGHLKTGDRASTSGRTEVFGCAPYSRGMGRSRSGARAAPGTEGHSEPRSGAGRLRG